MALQNWIGGGDAGLVGTAISAAGTTSTTATEVTAQINDVSTVASGSGVILNRLLAPGEEISVFNSGANPLKVYPPSGMSINALSANTPTILGLNTGIYFKCVSTARAFGIQSA